MKLNDIVILLKDTDEIKAGTEGIIRRKYSKLNLFGIRFGKYVMNLSKKEVILKENTTNAIAFDTEWKGSAGQTFIFTAEVTQCCRISIYEFDQTEKKYCSQCGKFIIYPKKN